LCIDFDKKCIGLHFRRFFAYIKSSCHSGWRASAECIYKSCQWLCTRVARWFVFKPKNPNLGKFWRVLQWKILVYFVTNRSILRPLEIFYGHLVYFVVIWYIFPRFGIFVPRKIWQPGTFSGEPFKSFTGVVFVVASL
jgi:hypothetical protein